MIESKDKATEVDELREVFGVDERERDVMLWTEEEAGSMGMGPAGIGSSCIYEAASPSFTCD